MDGEGTWEGEGGAQLARVSSSAATAADMPRPTDEPPRFSLNLHFAQNGFPRNERNDGVHLNETTGRTMGRRPKQRTTGVSGCTPFDCRESRRQGNETVFPPTVTLFRSTTRLVLLASCIHVASSSSLTVIYKLAARASTMSVLYGG